MSFELSVLYAVGLAYLALLFFLAYVTDKGWIPESWVRHPITYALSLGVFATSWTFYGSVGFAAAQGYNYLTIYLGVTLAFMLTPILLAPILRLVRDYQLTSVADLFAFRYRSPWTGVLVTLFMLIGVTPYISLQIKAVTESVQILSHETPPQFLALGFVVTLTLFAVLFGARHSSMREKHRGLVVAIAFESLVKLFVLLLVGGLTLMGVFGGFSGLDAWLQENPQALHAMYQPVQQGPWESLIFLSFAAAFLLPRQFHMLFTENLEPKTLFSAAWLFPLFLLLLNLPIPILLWAGQAQGLAIAPDYYLLGLALQEDYSPWLGILTFIGGISAASAMVIVTTLALSSMCLNHLLLPASYPDPDLDLYRWVLWGRRFLIGAIIFAGYLFYAFLELNQGLAELGLLSFVAVAQFIPGIVGLLFWRRATHQGFLGGLIIGIVIWAALLILPLLQSSALLDSEFDVEALASFFGLERWGLATLLSVAANSLVFVMVSFATRAGDDEQEAAYACCADRLGPPPGVVASRSTADFIERLAELLGHDTAQREVTQALTDLGMSPQEVRPSELRILRERIERNLSGLIGPVMANRIVNQRLAMLPADQVTAADNFRYMEHQLEVSQTQLRGLAAELDQLRRYHRQVLLQLPLGVCALDNSQHVVLWNGSLQQLTAIRENDALGLTAAELNGSWGRVLDEFAHSSEQERYKVSLRDQGHERWLNLHKALLGEQGMVILLEEVTERHQLEADLAHRDRLMSIGRLAAGVAHEIGNPLTGIASLTQNLRYCANEAAVHDMVPKVLEQVKRINSIVQTLLGFSHTDTPDENEAVLIIACVEEAVSLVKLGHKQSQLQFRWDVPETLIWHGRYQALLQILVNLLGNAVDAMPESGEILVVVAASANDIRLDVVDQGAGMSDEQQKLIFEPFFTTKPVGKGTGLGLYVVFNLVRELSGSITVESQAGIGTRFSLVLPMNPSV